MLAGSDDAEISLVNPGTVPAAYRFEFVGDTGTVGGSTEGILGAGGRIAVLSSSLRPAGSRGGYVHGTGAGVLPMALMGNSQWIGSLNALVASGLTQTFFSQVAQDSVFFTGLAAINVNAQAAVATVTVFDTQGAVVRIVKSSCIDPGGRPSIPLLIRGVMLTCALGVPFPGSAAWCRIVAALRQAYQRDFRTQLF